MILLKRPQKISDYSQLKKSKHVTLYFPRREYPPITRCYYHFLFSVLFPLVDFHLSDLVLPSCVYNVPSIGQFDSLIRGLETWGLNINIVRRHDRNCIALGSFEPFVIEGNCAVFRPTAQQNSRLKRAVNFLKTNIANHANIDTIVIERNTGNSNRRLRMDNLRDSIGAHVFDLDGMSLVRQIGIFDNAKTIIAEHGSALGNMVFAPPGAHIIEICPPRFTDRFFNILAHVFKLRYDRIENTGSKIDPDIVKKVINDGQNQKKEKERCA